MTSYNGIAGGWLPDYNGPQPLMGSINDDTGKKACTYGQYSQITSDSYDDSQLTGVMSDLLSSGAVFVPAIMPTGVSFSDVASGDLPSQIATTVQKFTSQGITVWLRFAHEMNYYVTDGTYAGGTPSEFIDAWNAVYNAVKDIDGCYMFWTPNVDQSSNLQQWFPGADNVDIVGMDDYPYVPRPHSSLLANISVPLEQASVMPLATFTMPLPRQITSSLRSVRLVHQAAMSQTKRHGSRR